ncbi:MAG: ABC transporter ATP-binding protein [Dissulfurimicrobium sp.]|uniref:ABC transporter ATP-binding protein n=1 Tax=Dissulfurimicrobium TaxID=1769732 RepID=UPI001EDB8B08|nr:ABC transporter ATP-binding protein [Dissulfurimicrobium hydrothermale]UKL13403.1 ABC transporter ATP-binding protein [Dissulfurimicrobium hydrothermale]
MLEIKDISAGYQSARTNGQTTDCHGVLKRVGFKAMPGEVTAILGPNGSGKTTLFRCISGQLKPKSGAIYLENQDITTLAPKKRAKLLSCVPQDHEPPFPYSVFDVVLMGRTAHVKAFSMPSGKDYMKAEEAIEEVGIAGLRDRRYTMLSGGERQLVLMARAIAQDTPVLLLDEPTSHLDFRNQLLVLKKVRDMVMRKGLITLMTIHDPNLAAFFSDRVVMINNGSVISHGKPSQVISEESLRLLYGIDVFVLHHNGMKIIIPSALSLH